MSVETIIAIVTAGIALVTSAVSFSYNLIQNRKSRIQKVILDNRIKYLYGIREGFTDFIGLANAGAITAATHSEDIKKVFVTNLFSGYGKIKTYIKPFYEIDEALLKVLNETYFCILDILNGKSERAAEIDGLRESLEDKYLKYDWAYWKYIQSQKEGNFMNSDDAFDEVYYQFVKSLNKK